MIKSVNELKKEFNTLHEQEVTVQGWIRTNRAQKEFGFISFNDGSSVTNIQIVYTKDLENFEQISKFRVGCSLTVTGKLLVTPNTKQDFEINASSVYLKEIALKIIQSNQKDILVNF